MDYRYWDSVCFLGWLSEEADKMPACQPVLEAAEAGTVTLITSALTIAQGEPVAQRPREDPGPAGTEGRSILRQ